MGNFDELELIAKPIIEYIKKNYNPHTSIVISEESIKVVADEIYIPIIEKEEK